MKQIGQICKGDLCALESLYQQHKTKVFHLALSMTGDIHLAEDITQEKAFTYRNDRSKAAYEHLASERKGIPLLYGIVPGNGGFPAPQGRSDAKEACRDAAHFPRYGRAAA